MMTIDNTLQPLPPPLLEVSNLVVGFDGEDGLIRAVDDVSLTIPAGLTIGLVGESGCGKSVTALSIMRLLPQPSGRILHGRIRFQGLEITGIPADDMHAVRGKRISMIFQEPMTALNPVHRIGKQVQEVFYLHQPELTDRERIDKSAGMLSKMGIPDPLQRMMAYPHQISGGMRQRVMIAMALACHPELLIADEPTTALDVTIQAQILELMRQLQAETGMAILFITHDMGVVAEMCDLVMVMYAGKIVESAPVRDLFSHPRHPYTRGLLESIPRLETPAKTRLNVIRGMAPSLQGLPSGCRFENRCPMAQSLCQKEAPELREVMNDHFVSCHFA